MTSELAENAFLIRAARSEEIPPIQQLELEATQRFHDLPGYEDVPDDVTPTEELEQALADDLLWVAEIGGEIAGYVYAASIDDCLHIEEVSVLPRYGRRGLGRALVQTVIDQARKREMAGVSLTTFRDVPWNAPFYSRIGFHELQPPDITPDLRKAMDDEARRGLPIDRRVAMRYSF